MSAFVLDISKSSKAAVAVVPNETLYFTSPVANYQATSGVVMFSWFGAGVFDLIVYTNPERTIKAIGSNAQVMDTNGLGAATTHTFTNDVEDGGARYYALYRWPTTDYYDLEMEVITGQYTAYDDGTNVVSVSPSGGTLSGSSQTFAISNLPGGMLWSVRAGAANDSDAYDNSGAMTANATTTLYNFPTNGGGVVVTLYVGDGVATPAKTYLPFTAHTAVVYAGTTQLFVNLAGSDGNTGTSEVDAKRTIQAAVDIATSDTCIHVKAGNYGDSNIATKANGTLGTPICILGYTTTPGDAPSVPSFDHESSLNASLMPILNHGNRTDASTVYGIVIDHDYVKISGFGVTEFTHGALITDNSEYSTLEDVYIKDVGDYTHTGGGYRGVGAKANGTNFTMRRVVVVNASGEALSFGAASADGFIEYSKAYCNEGREPTGGDQGTDYYCIISGFRHRFSYCHVERVYDLGHGGHGYRFQAATDCIVEDSTGRHMKNGVFTTKETPVGRNVFRRCTAEGSGTSGAPPQSAFTSTGNGLGVHMLAGGGRNVFEDIILNDVQYGIAYNQPDSSSVFRRIEMNNVSNSALSFSGTGSTTNTTFDELDVNGAGYLYKFWGGNTLASSCSLTNSVLTGVTNKYNGSAGSLNQMTNVSGSTINTPHTLP